MTPAHVGECADLIFEELSDGRLLVCEPWPRFVVISDEFLVHMSLDDTKRNGEGMAVELTFRCANGQATYRRVGRDKVKRESVWELVEGEYRPDGRTE